MKRFGKEKSKREQIWIYKDKATGTCHTLPTYLLHTINAHPFHFISFYFISISIRTSIERPMMTHNSGIVDFHDITQFTFFLQRPMHYAHTHSTHILAIVCGAMRVVTK